MTIIIVFSLIFLIYSTIEVFFGLKKIDNMDDEITDASLNDSIVVIIAARNEDDNIKSTLENLSNQSYRNIKIICVNDRSTDDTVKIISQYAMRYKHIDCINVSHIPDGWVAKNYVCQVAAKQVKSDWIIFMDADVQLSHDAISKAVSYAKRKKLDHVTVFVKIICSGLFHKIFQLIFNGHGYLISLKPWLASSVKSKRSINSGAFYLLRHSTYQTIGGHEGISNELIDDIKIGEKIKKSGFKQAILNAQTDMSLPWYPSLKAMAHGFKKNFFAYFNFNLIKMMLVLITWCTLFILPFMAPLFTHGLSFILGITYLMFLIIFYLLIASYFSMPKYLAFLSPIGFIIYLYPATLSVLHYFRHRGVIWRDTWYSKGFLKKEKSN